MLDVEGIHPVDAGRALVRLGWLAGAALAVAQDDGPERLDTPEGTWAIGRHEPLLFEAHVGSPLSIVIDVADELLIHGSALALLAYGLKRFWALDLELKTKRLRATVDYYDAVRDAEEARAKANGGNQKSMADIRSGGGSIEQKKEREKAIDQRREAEIDQGDEARGWPAGSTAAIDARADTKWSGGDASIRDS